MRSTLSFYGGSADKPAGCGAGESKGSEDFTDLNTVRDWRRMLCNEYCGSSFNLDERRWQSVEHYCQANKFAMTDRPYYETFTLDSGSARSSAAGRSKKLTAAQRAEWDDISADILAAAREAKFKQNIRLARALLFTRNAVLMHKGEIDKGLMQLRYDLSPAAADQRLAEYQFAEHLDNLHNLANNGRPKHL